MFAKKSLPVAADAGMVEPFVSLVTSLAMVVLSILLVVAKALMLSTVWSLLLTADVRTVERIFIAVNLLASLVVSSTVRVPSEDVITVESRELWLSFCMLSMVKFTVSSVVLPSVGNIPEVF